MARPYWAGDLSNAEWSLMCCRPAACRRLRPSNKSAGLPSPHVPADILSGGHALCSSSDSKTQRIWGQRERGGRENRTWRFSFPHSYFQASFDLDKERLVSIANQITRSWDHVDRI
jgi:hypothetical protein